MAVFEDPVRHLNVTDVVRLHVRDIPQRKKRRIMAVLVAKKASDSGCTALKIERS